MPRTVWKSSFTRTWKFGDAVPYVAPGSKTRVPSGSRPPVRRPVSPVWSLLNRITDNAKSSSSSVRNPTSYSVLCSISSFGLPTKIGSAISLGSKTKTPE